jgi:hypothetical protein
MATKNDVIALGPTLLLDANTVTGADGDALSPYWADDSATGATFSGTGSGHWPLLKTAANGINGNNVLRFDGSDDQLSASSIADLDHLIAATGYVMWCVFRAIALDTNDATHMHRNDSLIASNDETWGLHFRSAPTVHAYVADASLGDKSTSQSIATGTPYISRTRHNGTNLYHKLNGVAESAGVACTPVVANTAVLIGGIYVATNIDIAEIIIFNTALSTENMAVVDAYLAAKYFPLYQLTTSAASAVGAATGVAKALHRVATSRTGGVAASTGFAKALHRTRTTVASALGAVAIRDLKVFSNRLTGGAATAVGSASGFMRRVCRAGSGSSPAVGGATGFAKALHRAGRGAASVLGGVASVFNKVRHRAITTASSAVGGAKSSAITVVRRLLASPSSAIGSAIGRIVGASVYERIGWAQHVFLSAANFNRMETIYPAAVAEIDAHHHPMRHYGMIEADSVFGYSGQSAHLDADLVDSHHRSDITTSALPNGIALAYSGTANDFTGGYLTSDSRWHLCDGGTYNGYVTPAAIAARIMIMKVVT